MLRLFHLIWVLINTVHAFENWPTLSTKQDDAIRTQRDVAEYIPLDQLSLFGISLNRAIFDPHGYNKEALSIVLDVLNLRTGVLLVDMYWNEFTLTWQLCPGPFPDNLTANMTDTVDVYWNGKTYQCLPGFSPADLMSTLNLYLRSTNVNLEANIVLVLLRLKSIFYQPHVSSSYNHSTSQPDTVPPGYASPNSAYLAVGNLSLAQSISGLGSFLFTPLDLNTFSASGVTGNYTNYYSSKYPTMYDFLFNFYKRTMIHVISNELHDSSKRYNISLDDRNTIFFGNSSFSMSVASASNTSIISQCDGLRNSEFDPSRFTTIISDSHFRVVVDNDNSAFTNSTLRQWAECGFSPILNATYAAYTPHIGIKPKKNESEVGAVMNNYIPNHYWSWVPNQPDTGSENSSTSWQERDHYRRDRQPYEALSDSQFAYKCVAMSREGWSIRNCYDKYRVACQNKSNPFDWTILGDLSTYFDFKDDNKCPDRYLPSLPHLSVEQGALSAYLTSRNILSPVWIDLNDITITGCFVSGGPYAQCPYKQVVTARNLIRRIAPSLVVAFVILVLIFYSNIFLSVPVHTNRKRHWKRVINQYNKMHEYEGVPS